MTEPSPPNGPGLRLARAFDAEVLAPMMAREFPALRYAAALIGSGSEVLGFDTRRSTDHDWGPRLQVFLPPGTPARPAVIACLDRDLPDAFHGYPTRFTRGPNPPDADDPTHNVVVTDVATWSRDWIGADATSGLDVIDWLSVSWQSLAEMTGGAVFHDGLGTLTALRSALTWYPVDVWRYVLACQWQRVGQEEAFVGRTGEVGDDLGATVLVGRIVRDLMRLALLLRRHYPPYGKWLGTAFGRLPDATVLGPMFTAALSAIDGRGRERNLCRAYEYLAAEQNALRLTEPVEPTCRSFHNRPFQVLDARRFTVALRAAVTDPAVRRLPPVGAVDQFIDSTDVAADVHRARRTARALLTGR